MSPNKSIAIVGAGPTGLSVAIMLRLRGYDPIVLDRRTELTSLPAAHVVNTRSMEVLAELGVADQVRSEGSMMSKGGKILWVESLVGREYGRLTGRGAARDARGPISTLATVNLAQTKMEQILHARLQELGGDVRTGQTVLGVEARETGATLTVRSEHDGGESTIDCDWVIGCDGAGSAVRHSIGIEMEGPQTLARFMTIYFNADLDRFRKEQDAVLYWIGGKDVRGVFINFDLERGRTWAMLVPIGDLPIDTFDMEDARKIIVKAVGSADADIEVFGLSSWNMSAQVASNYRNGRVLLAGDACHRFPPTGGLGMNTGIQDAHNLVWKLDAVIRGEASEVLLDTYEEERRPIAQSNTAQSVTNLMELGRIDQALGIQTLAPIAPDAAKGPVIAYPAEFLGIDGDSSDACDRRAKIQQAIDEQAAHFAQGAGADVGFSYRSGAFTPDGSKPPSDGPLHYSPDAHPGARLPSASPDKSFESSTLAKVHQCGITVFAADARWRDCIVATDRVDAAFEALDEADWNGVPIFDLFGIDETGAVAVRPDGHVLWRQDSWSDDGPALLKSAMLSVYDTV